ncbi:hypothetical protein [Pleionea sediminis]|uniref:hypothetical protein n=1 Tax=Pleionea sediminis TaxID=2569479 RepID=UPI001184EF20|nr:hypothetical protein [Pleionea sediminis]
MRMQLFKVCFIVVSLTLSSCNKPPKSIQECESAFKKLSKGKVISVSWAYKKDYGDSREHYYRWGKGENENGIKTTQGKASGSCVIHKRSGKGFLTLNGKDLGGFKAKL